MGIEGTSVSKLRVYFCTINHSTVRTLLLRVRRILEINFGSLVIHAHFQAARRPCYLGSGFHESRVSATTYFVYKH